MTNQKQMRVTLLPDEDLALIARIIGSQSAAQLALNDMARRREQGEDPVAVQFGESIFVVPRADLSTSGALNMEH